MPLPNTRVIHPMFSVHHQPTVEGMHTAVCDITRPGTGRAVLNKTTGAATQAATTIGVDVSCRVQAAASSDRTVSSGDQQVTIRKYVVTIPATIAPLVDDVVTITSAVDASLTGRVLRVVDVIYGSEVWERALSCIDVLG